MKRKIIAVVAMTIGLVFNGQAQEKDDKNVTGTMMASKTKTFTFEKDGKSVPYQVTVHEKRDYTASFDKEDEGMVDQDRLSTPAQVAKLITVYNEEEPTFNRFIVLRYDKQVTDTFKLVPTEKGFAVKVDNQSVNYILGEGLYYTNTADKDFFSIDIFNYIL